MSPENFLVADIESSDDETLVSNNSDELDFDGQKNRLKLKRFSDNTENRKGLAKWTTWVVTVWLFLVLAILFFNSTFICLSDSVLIALLGTTTVNVLGLSYIVLKGYFDSISNNEV
jgi:hypothetical protein